MSHKITRMHIVVKNKSDWEKLYDLEMQEAYGLYYSERELFEHCEHHFVSDGFGCDDTESFMYDLIDTLGKNCLMICDSTDMQVDPYTHCMFYLGSELQYEYFGDDNEKGNMFHETDIAKIKDWFNYGEFNLSEKEMEHLNQFLEY